MRDKGCYYAAPGWWCSREPRHKGPCAARPRWWNISGWLIYLRWPR